MRSLCCFAILLLVAGCREKYDSPVKKTATGYLVIDGVVNSGPGITTLTLSRTTSFDNRTMLTETGAFVRLQGDDSSVHPMNETAAGQYSSSALNLDPAHKYRLLVSTSNGGHFASDFVPVRNNPPIDSISRERRPEGLQLYINTHDPANNTRYYQWSYVETWQITSTYSSLLKYQVVVTNGHSIYSVVYKDSTTFSYDPTIFNCWQTFSSSDILLGSTAKLSQDIVNLPLNLIPATSVKLSVLYSILVTQNTWGQDGYEFLDRMRKNTESTGSIFDAQPSQLAGNIHNVNDAAEPVIGYFNICPLQQKRMFISNSEVPGWGYTSGCTSEEIPNISDSIVTLGLDLMPTTTAKTTPRGQIQSFNAAAPICVDCTLRGTNVKPSFWP